jgi:hypothetical protein
MSKAPRPSTSAESASAPILLLVLAELSACSIMARSTTSAPVTCAQGMKDQDQYYACEHCEQFSISAKTQPTPNV